MEDIKVGDKIRFVPQSGNRWWTVKARDERYLVAVRKAEFTKDDLFYTVVDLTGWTFTYNGVPPGIVRSSLNTIGGGYDVGTDGENCHEILEVLNSGQFELSHRRVAAVQDIERKK
jgi:hypothetical protein